MSDIKKQLILEVSLGSQKLKSELASLKKDLEAVGRSISSPSAARKGGVSDEVKKAREIEKAYKTYNKQREQVDDAYASRSTQKEKARVKNEKVAYDAYEKQKRQTSDMHSQRQAEMAKKRIKDESLAYKQYENQQKEMSSAEMQREKTLSKEKLNSEKKLGDLFDKQQKDDEKQSKKEKTDIAARTAAEIKGYEAAQRRKDYLDSDDYKKFLIRQRGKRAVEDRDKRKQESEDAQAALKRRLRDFKAGKGGGGGEAEVGGPEKFLKMLGRGSAIAAGIAAAGHALQAGPNVFEDYKMMQASRRHEQSSNLLNGQFVSQYSRDYGRQFSAAHLPMTAGGVLGGALKGAGMGGAIGVGAGALFSGGALSVPLGLLGAGIGGVAGGIYGGIDSYMGFSEKRAARFQKETQPLQDASNAAMRLNPMRLDMIKKGASSALLNINEKQGAEMGFAPEEANAQYAQLQDILGNKGAASTINTARRLNLNTGADVGATGTMVQALTGANRREVGGNVAQTESMVSRALANGLDRSKTSKYLQETSSFIQSSTIFSKINTGAVSDRLTGMASAFGNGTIDETSLRQAKNAAQMQYQASFAEGGTGGLGNMFNYQDTFKGKNLGGLDTDWLLGLSQNATAEDAMKGLSDKAKNDPEMAGLVKKFIENKSQNWQTVSDKLGSQITNTMMRSDTGLSSEDTQNLRDKTTKRTLKEGVDITNTEVAGSTEQGMAVRNAKLGKEEVDLGRQTFQAAIENTATDLNKLRTVFAEAVTTFNTVLKDLNMKQIQYSPAYSGSNRSNGGGQ